MSKRKANKILLIGWDAADWKVINPLVDAGKMPSLEKMINGGVMGKLATLDPPLSPMLWTSIATGKTADEHGILGFTQPDKQGKFLHPVLSTSRKVKAVWNILMQEGLKSNVVGWWPSHPAEPINGIYVSNFYHKLGNEVNNRKPLADNTVHPANLTKIMEELRVFTWELTEAHLLPFVPDAVKIDQDNDLRLNSIAKTIAEVSTIHSAATWIMENSEWDFMAVYYDGIDHFGHGFMNYHPPKQDHISDKDFEIYKGVVEAGYLYHDMMLERLIELAGEDTTVILVSDHGFHSDHLRPQYLANAPAAPAAQHSPYGIFCASGPNIKKDELIFGSTLLDITPTILDLFGLPVAKDMVGKPLLQIYEKPEKPDYIQSWEKIAGECGMHTDEAIRDPWAEQEALDQLIALGYIDPPGENVKEHIDKSVRESKFYLARVYLDSKKLDKALPILEEIYKQNPEETRYALYLIKCFLGLDRPEDGLNIMDDVKKLIPEMTPQMNLMTGKLLLLKNDLNGALEYLEAAELQDSGNFAIYIDLGHSYLGKKLLDKAENSFLKSIKINKDSAMGHFGLGQVLQKKNHLQSAAEEFITAVRLLHFFPNAHYFLGDTLFKLKYYEQAEKAFKTAVSQAPGMEKAHLYLIELYTNILNKPEKVEFHQRIIREKILPQKMKRRTEWSR